MTFPEKNTIYIVKLGQTYTDSETAIIIDHLKNGCSVIVNFSEAESTAAFTVLYNLFGAIYALDGSYQRLGEEVYIFSTKDMKVL